MIDIGDKYIEDQSCLQRINKSELLVFLSYHVIHQ